MGNSEKNKKPGKIAAWWKGLKGQFKTISWPARDEVVSQTTAVVIISVVLSVLIAVVDIIIRFGLGFLVK